LKFYYGRIYKYHPSIRYRILFYSCKKIPDTQAPTITSLTPVNDTLFPIGNISSFLAQYNDTHAYSSGINTSSAQVTLKKWNSAGATWGTNIATSYLALTSISTSQAAYHTTQKLPYGKYQFTFSISDAAGNTTQQTRVFYVDEVEFSLSQPSIDIGNIQDDAVLYTSSDELIVTVKTVGA